MDVHNQDLAESEATEGQLGSKASEPEKHKRTRAYYTRKALEGIATYSLVGENREGPKSLEEALSLVKEMVVYALEEKKGDPKS